MKPIETILMCFAFLGCGCFSYLAGFVLGKFTDTTKLYRKIEEQEKELINLRGMEDG